MKITSVNYMCSREEANSFIGGIRGVAMIALKSPTQLRWYNRIIEGKYKETIATWKKAVGGTKLGTMEVNIRFVPRESVSRIKEIV